MALTKCANYESALCDANVMQQLSFSSVIRYIRESSIYSKQEKHRHVIVICKWTLHAVDTKGAHHTTLPYHRCRATARQMYCLFRQISVDIIITTTLVSMFMTIDIIVTSIPCQYMQLTLWRNHIIQCVDGLGFSWRCQSRVIVKDGLVGSAYKFIPSRSIFLKDMGRWFTAWLRHSLFEGLTRWS